MIKYVKRENLIALVSEDRRETLFVEFNSKKDDFVVDVVSNDTYYLKQNRNGILKTNVEQLLIPKNSATYINGRLYTGKNIERFDFDGIERSFLTGMIEKKKIENLFYEINNVKHIEYTKDLVLKK